MNKMPQLYSRRMFVRPHAVVETPLTLLKEFLCTTFLEKRESIQRISSISELVQFIELIDVRVVCIIDHLDALCHPLADNGALSVVNAFAVNHLALYGAFENRSPREIHARKAKDAKTFFLKALTKVSNEWCIYAGA